MALCFLLFITPINEGFLDFENFLLCSIPNILLANEEKSGGICKNRWKNNFTSGFWKLKNKYFPKDKSSSPVGEKNLEGQIETNEKELKLLY